MTLPRRTALLLLLFTCVAAWAALYQLARFYQSDARNYSLVEDGLYIGGLVKEPPPGTSAVLNLCRVEDSYEVVHSLWLPIPDSSPAPSLDWLRKAVDFVDEQRNAGRTTFVHCRMGVSRSAMVTAAYLMRKHHWTRDEALAFLRTTRPGVRPNPAFMDLLLEWEQALQRQALQR